MRATIHPSGIILTAALWALVSRERLDYPMSSLYMVSIIAFMGSRGVHAPEVFLIFTTQLYQYFSLFALFALFSDEPKVFLPKYSQTTIYLTLFTSGG